MHLIASDARRGAETFAVGLAAALGSHGDQAAVAALVPSHHQVAHGVPVLGTARRSPRTLAALRRAAASADVVVAHGSSTLEACAVGLTGHPTPWVYRTIGDPSYWVDGALRARALAFAHRRASRHVALWDGARAQLVDLHRLSVDRVDVIPNAVPSSWTPASMAERTAARRDLGVSTTGPCLAYVGALSPEKDVAAALDAVTHLDDATLVIAGVGPDEAELRRRAEASAGRVKFLGALTDPRPVYAAADLLLLPSRSEGMPAVVIEAGLVGTASVATTVGALPEMINTEVDGFLAPPNDHDAFAAAVRRALPRAATAGAAAATSFRERYTLESTVAAWQRTLRAACR